MNYLSGRILIADTECYRNLWSIGLYDPATGKKLIIEHSARKPMTDAERERLRALMLNNVIVGYNWQAYDIIMVCAALDGASNAQLKQTNDRIILGGLKWWDAEAVLGIVIPRAWKFIDLIEPQPNAFASLKTLAGRMHAPTMRDLPYHPDSDLTEAQMDEVLSYMVNDLMVTAMLFEALQEPLALRDTFSREYGINLMSKSDAQMGEAIIKKRVEQEIGEKVFKVETPAGTTFRYPIPAYMRFERPELQAILDRLRGYDFMVQGNGKVELPEWLANGQITIGESTYQMGIGGLHSTEKNRSIHSDDEFTLVDFDVGSYYPAIIINSGLYPKALGPKFLEVFRKIRDERIHAKKMVKQTEGAERARWQAAEKGLKIALNGTFGKLGSPYSVLYAPHLLIAVTLTGQLALLMLIERAEAMGISVVSGNTDGVVFRVPRDMMGSIKDDRVTDGSVKDLIEQWEADTGFVMEATEYQAIYNRSVNDYIAVKPGGKVKWKGVIANPWRDGDLRGQLMKNPQMPIIANAVVDLITKGTPIEETIRSGTDVKDYVTVVKVDGGATWRGDYLGKVVRYHWAQGGEEILRAKAHKTTGNHGKVSKSDGCRPLMELPDSLPGDVDYDAYIAAAREVLMDIGYHDRPAPVKPVRVYRYNAVAWFALAA